MILQVGATAAELYWTGTVVGQCTTPHEEDDGVDDNANNDANMHECMMRDTPVMTDNRRRCDTDRTTDDDEITSETSMQPPRMPICRYR